MVQTTKRVEVDFAHRLTNHSGKCRSVHGHRYVVDVTITDELATCGSSEGMCLDFSILKKVLNQCIDNICDHSLVLWDQDPLVDVLKEMDYSDTSVEYTAETTRALVYEEGFVNGKTVLVNFIPTSENLAKWWFELISFYIYQYSDTATVLKVRVYETPSCYSDYSEAETCSCNG